MHNMVAGILIACRGGNEKEKRTAFLGYHATSAGAFICVAGRSPDLRQIMEVRNEERSRDTMINITRGFRRHVTFHDVPEVEAFVAVRNIYYREALYLFNTYLACQPRSKDEIWWVPDRNHTNTGLLGRKADFSISLPRWAKYLFCWRLPRWTAAIWDMVGNG